MLYDPAADAPAAPIAALSPERAGPVRREIVGALLAMGIHVEAAHREAAAGQHELSLRATGPLALADALAILPAAVKRVSLRHGVR